MDEHHLQRLLEIYPVEHFWIRVNDIIKKSDYKHRSAQDKLKQRRSNGRGHS